MNITRIILLLILSLIIITSKIEAQNLSLNKSYTSTAIPNYQYSAAPSDKTSLTDGIYTKGNFWTEPTTVGWQQQQVSITIDLGKVEPVGSVTFNTVRNINSGISFPKNIFVFISGDNRYFKFVGDAADTPDNLQGPLKIKKFTLNGINEYARYVTLKIIPQGLFIFCDEIEVRKGLEYNNPRENLMARDSLGHFIDSLEPPSKNRRAIARSFQKLKMFSIENNRNFNRGLFEIDSQLDKNIISENDLLAIKNKIRKQFGYLLKIRFKVPFIVEKFNPWDSLCELREPKTDAEILNYEFSMPKDGAQYGSFVITNCDSSAQKFSFEVSNPNPTFNNIELFNVPYVHSTYYTEIPDPLISVKNGVTIDAGISGMFIFKIKGINAGNNNLTITVRSGNKVTKMNIVVRIFELFHGSKDNLNANVWAYLNYPMIKDRPVEAVNDLQSHHINTVVVPPTILPNMSTVVFSPFINYLHNFKSIKNILLFMNYASPDLRSGFKNGKFMSTDWKNNFILWYNKMEKLIQGNGFPNAQIYLYPYDEVGSENIGDFKNFVIWAKKAIPGIKFYATINNNKAIDSLLTLIDIAQILPYSYRLKELPPHECEIWIYTGNYASRSLSPYGFYRLMAWDAFVNDYNGIGFWDYADEGPFKQSNLINDPNPALGTSYSVIYDGPGKEIISSRRWEAFSLGIEDFSILKAYSKRFGIEKTKSMANQVIANPDDVNKADSVIIEMIKLISGK